MRDGRGGNGKMYEKCPTDCVNLRYKSYTERKHILYGVIMSYDVSYYLCITYLTPTSQSDTTSPICRLHIIFKHIHRHIRFTLNTYHTYIKPLNFLHFLFTFSSWGSIMRCNGNIFNCWRR